MGGRPTAGAVEAPGCRKGAEASGTDDTGSRYSHVDPALLALPLDRLPRPLLVESAVLDEQVYLCADEARAEAVKASGLVTYTAAEVAELVRAGTTPEGLRTVHAVKRQIWGRIVRTREWAMS